MSHRFGMVALLGKPNVGKSTLLNAFVGQKVSIVSNKPQTTRRRVLGIVTTPEYQIAFVDTPGIHDAHTQLGKHMVEAARESLGDADVILYVADVSKRPEEGDRRIAAFARDSKLPVILALNKMDKLEAEFVVEHIEAYCRLFGTEAYMLTTATQERNLGLLLEQVVGLLPEGEARYDEDDFTDQPLRFMAAELIREQVLLKTRQEIPHATAVKVTEWGNDSSDLIDSIDSIEEAIREAGDASCPGGPEESSTKSPPNSTRTTTKPQPNPKGKKPKQTRTSLTVIRAEIIVEKPGQRAILIGKQGQFLKEIGTAARLQIEELIGTRVHLDLFVKVKEDWRMSPRMLQEIAED